MEFIIYSIGDSEFLEQVLIALAMIAGVDDAGGVREAGGLEGVDRLHPGGEDPDLVDQVLALLLHEEDLVPGAQLRG